MISIVDLKKNESHDTKDMFCLVRAAKMTCEFDMDLMTNIKWRHQKFDFEQFVSDLICVSDDGKQMVMWLRESVVDRIIREKNLYKLGS
jgi:hypothetical protein